MATLALSSNDLADLMGVPRQTVDDWLDFGPPVERMEKIRTIVVIADILRHRLRYSRLAAVARRPAKAYGGRTMLEVIADDDHDWLLRSIRESFDYTRVA